MSLASRIRSAWGALTAPQMASDTLQYEPAGISSYDAVRGIYDLDAGYVFGAPGHSRYTRDRVITYPTLQRCLHLLAAKLASALTTGGHLRIVDREGRFSKRPSHFALHDLLGWSLDGGETPSYMTFLDLGIDYGLSGNALMEPVYDAAGRVAGITRYLAWGVNTYQGGVYRVTPADEWDAVTVEVPARRMMHARWARLLQYGREGSGRQRFATPPIITLRPALEAGLASDRSVLWSFRNGARSKSVISFPDSRNRQAPTAEQRKQIRSEIDQRIRSGFPLVLFAGASASRVDDSPSDPNFKALREHQIREASMIYGWPQLLLGEPTANWSGHIEAISRLAFRWGVIDHIQAFLAALGMRLLPRGYRLELDPRWMIAGDYTATAGFLRELRGDAQRASAVTLAEYRQIAGLPADYEGELMEAPMADGSMVNVDNNGDMGE